MRFNLLADPNELNRGDTFSCLIRVKTLITAG